MGGERVDLRPAPAAPTSAVPHVALGYFLDSCTASLHRGRRRRVGVVVSPRNRGVRSISVRRWRRRRIVWRVHGGCRRRGRGLTDGISGVCGRRAGRSRSRWGRAVMWRRRGRSRRSKRGVWRRGVHRRGVARGHWVVVVGGGVVRNIRVGVCWLRLVDGDRNWLRRRLAAGGLLLAGGGVVLLARAFRRTRAAGVRVISLGALA